MYIDSDTQKYIFETINRDKLIYLINLGTTSIDDDAIYNTARIILATINNDLEAKTFMNNLSIHPLTTEKTFNILKQAYNEIYGNPEKTKDIIKDVIYEFGCTVSDKLVDIFSRENEVSSSQTIYTLVYKCITLFSNQDDANLFIDILNSRVNDIRVSEYCTLSRNHLRYIIKRRRIAI